MTHFKNIPTLTSLHTQLFKNKKEPILLTIDPAHEPQNMPKTLVWLVDVSGSMGQTVCTELATLPVPVQKPLMPTPIAPPMWPTQPAPFFPNVPPTHYWDVQPSANFEYKEQTMQQVHVNISKLDFVKRTLRLMSNALKAKDQVILISFSDTANLVCKAFGKQKNELLKAIDNLQLLGGTNIETGLNLAFSQLNEHCSFNRSHRVVLFSDGEATHGAQSFDQFKPLLQKAKQAGFSLSALGVGLHYNEDLLSKMAFHNAGTFAHLQDPEAFKAIVNTEFNSLKDLWAQRISLKITAPKHVVLINAFNHPELIHPATSTAFNAQALDEQTLYFETLLPNKSQRTLLIELKSSKFMPTIDLEYEYHVQALDGTVLAHKQIVSLTMTEDKNIYKNQEKITAVQQEFDFMKAADELKKSQKAAKEGNKKAAFDFLNNSTQILRSVNNVKSSLMTESLQAYSTSLASASSNSQELSKRATESVYLATQNHRLNNKN